MATASSSEDDWQYSEQKEAPAATLLDRIVAQSIDSPSKPGRPRALEHVLADMFPRYQQECEELGFEGWRRKSQATLTYVVGELDRLLGGQLDEVIHHPKFQKLEAGWRGIQLLLRAADEGYDAERKVRVRVLNASWRDIQRDFDRASEFDQSEIFKKIYQQEFGMPGGLPFGAVIGNYEVHPRPSAGHPFDDVAILDELAGVAAAAFCPMVLGASPSLFGVDEFFELQDTKDLERGFQVKEFLKWRSFRKQEDARFIGIAMPRIIMRHPYSCSQTSSFVYDEDTTADVGKNSFLSKHLWGNAAFAWGCVLIRTFRDTGWLADIRGTERNRIRGGGLVTDLSPIHFSTDRQGVAPKTSTDLIITDRQEAELAKLGFIPLCRCKDTEFSAFYSSQSVQQPQEYSSEVATVNAHISSMLQYVLCVSRFAHYLKVIARDMTGSMIEPQEVEDRLHSWLQQYVTPDRNAKVETKARLPLSEAQVSVTEEPGKPGTYSCTFSLLPHYQLDQLRAAIRLTTKFNSLAE